MASEERLRAVITVEDRTAAPVHAINQRFAAMSAPLRQIGDRLGTLAEETGLLKIGERARHALGEVKHLGRGLLELAGPLAGLGAAASLGGLVEMAKKSAEFDKAIHLGAIATGLSTEKLGEWHFAAKFANVEAAALDKGVQRLAKNMFEGSVGKEKQVASLFRAMGHPLVKGHLPEMATTLGRINEEVSKLLAGGKFAAASAVLGTLMGARSGMALQPLFGQAPEELAKRFAQARRHGIAPTGEEAKKGDEMMGSWENMAGAVEGLSLAIGRRLYPEVMRIVDAMTDWIDDDRKWIASGIGDAVASFGDYLRSIDWSKFGEGLKEIATNAKWAWDNLGGMKTALGLIAAIELGPAIYAWYQLGAAVAAASLKFMLFPVAAFVASIATLVPAINGLRDVWIALDIAMSANPIGAVILGLTALAAIAYEVYTHLEQIRGVMEKLQSFLPKSLTHEGEAGHTDPETGGWAPDRPSLLKPGSDEGGAAPGGVQKAEAHVTFSFQGLPDWLHPKIESRAPAGQNLGVAMPF